MANGLNTSIAICRCLIVPVVCSGAYGAMHPKLTSFRLLLKPYCAAVCPQ